MTLTGGAPRTDELRELFLAGMSHAASTVYVVTTDGPAGRAGVTVSAMTSVTAEPPTILVCVHHKSAAATAIERNGVFCVNLLRDNQSNVADTFAGRMKTGSGDKFDCSGWETLVTGAPRATGTLVAFDCRLSRTDNVGTHKVFFGEVAAVHLAESGVPLLYARRAYGTPLRIDLKQGGHVPGEEIEALSLGCFHTFAPTLVPAIMEEVLQAGPDLDVRVLEGGQRRLVEALRVGEIDLALLYDSDGLDEDFERLQLSEVTPHVILPTGHRLAEKDTLSLAELAGEPMILLEAAPSIGFVLEQFDAMGLAPRIRFRTASLEMVRGMVGRGLGYGILATRPATDMTYAGHLLQIRALREDVPRSVITLVRSRAAPRSAANERFTSACLRYFGQA